MPKVRVNLSIERDVWEESKRLFDEIPVAPSISALVEQQLRVLTTTLGPVLKKAKAGDGEAAYQLLRMFSADAVTELGAGMKAVRMKLDEKAGKGELSK